MAGTGVVELTGCPSKTAQQAVMKYPAPEVVVQEIVELAQKLGRARGSQSLRQEHRARLGHEQRRADAMARHVADQVSTP
jgi:hypothetical protein